MGSDGTGLIPVKNDFSKDDGEFNSTLIGSEKFGNNSNENDILNIENWNEDEVVGEESDLVVEEKVKNTEISVNEEVVKNEVEYKTYTVSSYGSGEGFSTLWDISKDSGFTIEEIKAFNPEIREDNIIYPGQLIRVPIEIEQIEEVIEDEDVLLVNESTDNVVEENKDSVIVSNDKDNLNNGANLEEKVVNSDLREEQIDISNLSKEEFIEVIAPGAIKSFEENGVLPSVTIAQAILETGWGKHSVGNNLFGVKGKGNVAVTKEEVNGQLLTTEASFRAYDSIDDSIVDHGKVLSGQRYDSVREACKIGDYKEACEQLQACGYATDSSYPNLLISIIEKNNLTKYDSV